MFILSLIFYLMSFKAYIDNIESKTGKTPKDFKIAAEKKGLLEAGIKASVIFKWLKDEYGLGLGHARAIYMTLKPYIKKK